MSKLFDDILSFIRSRYNKEFIPLHEPRFRGNEKKYLNDCIDSTFVSSVGKYVDLFEKKIAEYIGAKYAVAAVNGTAALQIALLLARVEPDDEVITQPLTFVATANAISYTGAKPVFVDVEKSTLGMSPEALAIWLQENTTMKEGKTINKKTGKRISAIVPMHTFGHPCRIDEIVEIAEKYGIPVVEDAAESLGSRYKGKHTGTFGKLGIFSFNGNKVITTGGGGMIVTDDEKLAKLAKHITTTAKQPHPYEYYHDMTGYNYRLTNLAAALGVAQMEQLDAFLASKRKLAEDYKNFFRKFDEVEFFTEPENSVSNYWLNVLIFKDKKARNDFLDYSNANGVMTRPAWVLMNKLPMYKDCQTGNLENAEWLADKLVNIPSSVI